MDLRHLTDDCLLQETKKLVRRERECTTILLHHLREIERRKLFSDLSCTSLFDYCTRILGYSEGSAQRRILAARLLNELPELDVKIESGSLSLINIASAASFFKQESIRAPEMKIRVLGQLENLSKSNCERKLLELSGKPLSAREDKRWVSAETMKVSMLLSGETVQRLEEVRNFVGRNVSNEKLISLMARITIERLKKKKFKLLD